MLLHRRFFIYTITINLQKIFFHQVSLNHGWLLFWSLTSPLALYWTICLHHCNNFPINYRLTIYVEKILKKLNLNKYTQISSIIELWNYPFLFLRMSSLGFFMIEPHANIPTRTREENPWKYCKPNYSQDCICMYFFIYWRF